MNAWQFLRQLRYLLKTGEWTTDVPVFADDSVIETVAPDDAIYTSRRSPIALVAPGGFTADEQEPNLLRHRFGVRVAVTNAHDPAGEAAIIGANRVSQTDSRGRGILELEEKVFDAVEKMDRTEGVRVLGTTRTRSPVALGVDPYVVAADYEIEAHITTDRTYPGVRKATGSASGSEATLTWTLPATRFDTLSVIVRRASGATAPASATAGTGVTLGSALATTVTEEPGAGTWSYSIWVSYDEYGSGTAERYSGGADVLSLTTTAAATVTFFQSDYYGDAYFGPFFKAVA